MVGLVVERETGTAVELVRAVAVMEAVVAVGVAEAAAAAKVEYEAVTVFLADGAAPLGPVLLSKTQRARASAWMRFD